MKKPKFITDSDVATLKRAKRIFDKIDKNMRKLFYERCEVDANRDKDKGGKKWSALTLEIYDNLDYLYKRLNIDTYSYPRFVDKDKSKELTSCQSIQNSRHEYIMREGYATEDGVSASVEEKKGE